MKKRFFPIATAALFGLGLMSNLGCPAPGTDQGGGCMGGAPTAAVPQCGQGTVDHGDGKGCVPYQSKSGGRPGGGGCPSNMEMDSAGRCVSKSL